ncbi:unnamed protein product [Ixodes hexagonus]
MNVEVKARISDRDALLRLLEPMAESHRLLRQTDTFFRVGHGRLKLRQSTACGLDGTPAEESCALFFYDRPDVPGPKLSRYEKLRLDSLQAALTFKSMLERSLGTLGTVSKERHLLLLGSTRVHVDRVQGLGDFLELEVPLGEGQRLEEGEAAAEALLATLGVERDSLVPGSYLDLLAHMYTT